MRYEINREQRHQLDASFANTMHSQDDMEISTVCPHLKRPGEPVHQSVNGRNKSDVLARDKLQSIGFDGTVEEHG